MNLRRINQFKEVFFKSGWEDNVFNKENELGESILNRADLLLDDKIVFDDPLDMEPCSIPYNIQDFKWNKYPGHDVEWCYMLNRQGFLVDLAISYKITNKKKYLKKYKELVLDFIHSNGVPDSTNKNSWRSIDVGIRLQNLIKSFTYCNISDVFLPEEVTFLKKSILTHVKYLSKVYISSYDLSNWGVLSISGLAAVDLFFPDLIDNKTNKFIWEKLEKQVELQFYSDGLHWEQSPLYHHQVVIALLYLVLVSNYLEVELPFALDQKLKKPIKSSYYYANNKDVTVPLNDSDRVNLNYVYNIYRHMDYLESIPTNNNSLLYVGSLYEFKEYLPKQKKNNEIFIGSSSGFYSYKDEETYFTVFNGLHGSGHAHASHGSFTLDVNSRPILIDSGRYTYAEHPHRINLKKEQAHNSISVKYYPATKIKNSWGFDKLAKPLSHNYKDTQYGPLFHMSWTGRGPLSSLYVIERTILYIREFKTFIFYDSIQKNHLVPSSIEVNFNLDKSIRTINKSNNIVHFYVNDLEMKLWAKKSNYKITEQIMSEIYNYKSKHKRVTNSLRVFDKTTGIINILSLDPNLKITNEKALQNNKSKVKTLLLEKINYVDGIKIQNDTKYLKLFFLNKEVLRGGNYFSTLENEGFYGLINIIEPDGKAVRLK